MAHPWELLYPPARPTTCVPPSCIDPQLHYPSDEDCISPALTISDSDSVLDYISDAAIDKLDCEVCSHQSSAAPPSVSSSGPRVHGWRPSTDGSSSASSRHSWGSGITSFRAHVPLAMRANVPIIFGAVPAYGPGPPRPLAPPYIDPPPPEVHEEPEWMALSVCIPVSPIAPICNLLRDYHYLVRSIGQYNQVIDSFCIVPWPLSLQDQIRLSRDLISALIFDYGGIIAWRFCSVHID
ncbi:hypothetical protein H0H92_013337 [Tricholoma furcatifolium]|nr:hypothetical protein H0H92_013337 [Tricholoma furcatifolium]